MTERQYFDDDKPEYTRYEYNLKILKRLSKFVDDNKDMRFTQALWAIGVIIDEKDHFYEESETTFERINKKEK